MMINDVHFCSSIKIRSRRWERILMKGCDDVALTEFVAVNEARVRRFISARLKETEYSAKTP